VRTPPADLTEAGLRDALLRGWRVTADRIDHLPVGFGSYHWGVQAGGTRWFLTVDDLARRVRSSSEPRTTAGTRLRAALATARSLADGGLSFVVAPHLTLDGDVFASIGERFAAALYPHVDGARREWGEFGSFTERMDVLDRVVAVHAATCTSAGVEDLAVPMGDELRAALDDLTGPWTAGPYGERARLLLCRHAAGVERLLDQHRRLAERVLARPERFVVTHGEPHPGNTLITDEGVALVDWDTALLAPPERDLWIVAGHDERVLDAYTAATGRAVLADGNTCYRLTWDVVEIALYIAELRGEHAETADTAESWRNLQHYLDPPRRWPELL
jgi:spectinomycin phosphotransferase/16S rRNA (guanine(1405)-N(7))-methyltransferase